MPPPQHTRHLPLTSRLITTPTTRPFVSFVSFVIKNHLPSVSSVPSVVKKFIPTTTTPSVTIPPLPFAEWISAHGMAGPRADVRRVAVLCGPKAAGQECPGYGCRRTLTSDLRLGRSLALPKGEFPGTTEHKLGNDNPLTFGSAGASPSQGELH